MKLMWLSRLILAFFVIATLKMIHIQFIKSNELQAEIIKDRVREEVLQPERGNILDRNGNIFAMSLLTEDIAVNPNLIVSKTREEKVAKVLSDNIKGLSYDDAMKILENKKLKYAVVAKQVDQEAAKKISDSGVGGIQITPSPKRLYPNDELGGTFLGFVNNNLEPGAGIELKMNEFLSGQKGYKEAEITPFGDVIPVGSQNEVSPVNGQNVQLSIDSYLQNVVENRLKQAVKDMEPESIQAVLMDPNNGQVLAMASYPSYNPSDYQKSDPNTWTNTPANFWYEPGSIMKPMFMAGALDYGTIKGNEIYKSGTINVNGTILKDWNHGGGWGMLSLEGIIANSSNVGMVQIGQTMTSKQTSDLFKKLGFDKPTGIELPGETIAYNFPTAKALNADPVRKANVSFGQGIMVTPIQMATAFSELINGGHKIQSTLIKQVTDNNGNVIYKPDQATGRVFTQRSADMVRGYLKNNMINGSGKGYGVDGVDGGGKTGSAWYVENGIYKPNAIIGSFEGFIPYNNPKYVLLISIKHPKNQEFGSTAAGPLFKDIMTAVAHYENLKPTTSTDSNTGNNSSNNNNNSQKVSQPPELNVPDLTYSLYSDAEQKLKDKFGDKVTVKKSGNGEVVSEQDLSYQNDGVLVVNLTTDKIKNGDIYNIPNFVGKTQQEVTDLLNKYKINYQIYGENAVVEQSVTPGQYLKPTSLQLWLK